MEHVLILQIYCLLLSLANTLLDAAELVRTHALHPLFPAKRPVSNNSVWLTRQEHCLIV
jgi:hypothetical protein